MYKCLISNTTSDYIISDIDFLTNYVYDYSFSKIQHKFKSEFINNTSSNIIGINLNPYLRTLLILKVAKQFIDKYLKIKKLVKFKINMYQNLPKSKTNNFNLDKYITNCKNGISYLIKFDGNIEFSKIQKIINYKGNRILYEISDEDYDYDYLMKIAKKYLKDSEINKIILNNNSVEINMFDEHYDINKFIITLTKLFKNLTIIQTFITNEEITMIKNYIKKMLIQSTFKKQNSSENDKYYFSSEYFEIFKKYIVFNDSDKNAELELFKIYENENESIDTTFTKNINKNNKTNSKNLKNESINTTSTRNKNNYNSEKINIKVDKILYNELFNEINDKEIEKYKNIEITDILKTIEKIYVRILNINPYALKFKNFHRYAEPFDFIYSYLNYRSIYEKL